MDSIIELEIKEIKANGEKETIFKLKEKYENLKESYNVSSRKGEVYFKIKLWIYGDKFSIKI